MILLSEFLLVFHYEYIIEKLQIKQTFTVI